MAPVMGPAESVLAATVARRHLLLGEPKVEIAEKMGLSRFKVARLIEAAREGGLVTIQIASPGRVDLDLSSQVKDALNLDHCAVVSGHDTQDPDGRDARAKVTADLLSEILEIGDVLGLPWSRSVLSMTEHLRSLPRVRVIQLSGAMEVEGANASAVDIVRAAARVSEGETTIFHAPFILDNAQAAASIRRQPSVTAGLRAIQDVTHAVVGIGTWVSGSSSIFEWAGAQDRSEAQSAGVVGETAGVFFNSAGETVHLPLTDRMITLSGDSLAAIPQVIAVAAGAGRSAALQAATAGGLVNSAVIDTALAQTILQKQTEVANEPAVPGAP
ncbi:MAG: sugar-binding domain-containing protein [Ornithinimicrobium sp.]